jgi:hypothetical protein
MIGGGGGVQSGGEWVLNEVHRALYHMRDIRFTYIRRKQYAKIDEMVELFIV